VLWHWNTQQIEGISVVSQGASLLSWDFAIIIGNFVADVLNKHPDASRFLIIIPTSQFQAFSMS
jgi:hypothetical protein